MKSPSILVLRGGAIGDFVVTLPSLQLLRRRWPNSHIEVVGYLHIAGLASACGLADNVRSLNAAHMARFFALEAEIPEEQAGYVAGFDVVLSYLYDPDGVFRTNMLAAGARRLVCCSPMVNGCHAVEWFLKPLEQMAIYPDGATHPEMRLREEHLANGRARMVGFGQRVLALHPGSGGRQKRWPLRRFMEVARLLKSGYGVTPVFFFGESDDDLWEEFSASHDGFGSIRNEPLVNVAECLSACAGYIGNDSGVSHIAAALGVPTVAVFGPTDPAVWGPRGRKVEIVREGEHVEDVSVERVAGARLLRDL